MSKYEQMGGTPLLAIEGKAHQPHLIMSKSLSSLPKLGKSYGSIALSEGGSSQTVDKRGEKARVICIGALTKKVRLKD
jgi:hypothetical protein